MGAFIGSFTSLAIYRLPLKQDIVYTRSYCPNCKHKLKTIDLVPIFSYIFLKGKCRNCGMKIRPRYLILEICSGIVTLLFVISTGFDIYNINIKNIIEILFNIIFITTLVLIAGIDKEHNKLQKSVIKFGLILEIIFLCFNFNFIRLIFTILLLAIIILNNKEKYELDVLCLILYTAFFLPLDLLLINFIALFILLFLTKKNSLFYYSIITILTLIIYNYVF